MKNNIITAEIYRDMINEALFKAVDEVKFDGVVKEAVRYSLEAGGKRIRPMLLLEFFRVYRYGSYESGVSFNEVMPCALAVEMIHTFSLIHDDLPCMDNDDLRRGKPSCHKKFSEWSALLAGDALPFYALELISDCGKDSKNRLRAVNEMCRAAGITGMIGGQQLDMEFEKRIPSETELIFMYNAKTSALLKAACRSGCILAEASEAETENAGFFAEKLGLAFQIIDDILDFTGDEEKLGKPVGSDKEQGKATYAALFGLKKAKTKASELTEEALSYLKQVPYNSFLSNLTEKLLRRDY